MSLILDLAEGTGRRAVSVFSGVRDFFDFVVSILRSFRSMKYLRFRSVYNIAVNQTFFTGVNALPFVVLIALILGATVIIQALTSLPAFGIEGFLGNLMVLIIAREAGPLITALIVISRSGAAIASEIATQKQSGEIRSLIMMGIDVRLYIVFPRILASVLSLLALIFIFDFTAFAGGYIISLSAVYMPVSSFFQAVLDAMTGADLISMLIKSFIFGVIIPLICCYYGFRPRSQFEIPIYVSRAVIRTLFTVILCNVVISIMFYL